MQLTVKSLISKLDKKNMQALENAIKICIQKKASSVDIEHWMLSLLQDKTNELK